MEKLPPELLFKIMLYLPLEDRLSCSLTCRRWAEAMSSSQLLHDIWLDIAGHEIKAAKSVLVNTQRQYTKLSLHGADLSKFDPDFWGKISANLRVLELYKCSWSNYAFYTILRQCTELESLKLVDHDYNEISIDDFIPPEGACHEELRDSLSHLRHLHLRLWLTTGILDLLLGLMPNVTSLFLSSCFEKKSDFLERLPSLLKKNRIIRTGAYFTAMDSEELIKFVEITSGSLEELQIDAIGFTESACDAIVNCTRLRRLTLDELPRSFHANLFKKLASNCPDLEVLNLDYSGYLEGEDMVHLLELKKLRALRLGGIRATSASLFGLKEISTLVELDLKRLNVDSRLMRRLGSLTDLRKLVIGKCANSDCFEALCEKFERLTELDLGSVRHLTDADGMKLCRFKQLRSLRFFDGRGLSDVTFERGVGSRAMKSLLIYGCSITDAGLMSIASHHERLEKLELYDCPNVTDAGFLTLLRHEARLKKLKMNDWESMRYQWCSDLPNICPRLRDWFVCLDSSDSSSNSRD